MFGIVRTQGFVNAYAGITLPSAASVGLHEVMGFTPVGVYGRVGCKFGAWHDVGWWQISLSPRPASPEEPISVTAVQGHVDWPDLCGAGEALVRDAHR